MKRNINILLYIVTLLYYIGLYTYPSILPGHINGIVRNLSMTGLILSMYGLLQIFFRLPVGIVSDIFSKHKLFTVIGLVALGVGPLVIFFSKGATGLIIGRSITGLAATTWVPLSAIVISNNKGDPIRFSSFLIFISNLGSIIGVSLTPLLMSLGNGLLPVFTTPALVAIVGIILMLLVPTSNSRKSLLSAETIKSAIFDPKVFIPGALFALIQICNFAGTFTFIPLLGQEMGMTKQQSSIIMNCYFITSMVFNLITPKMLKKFGTNFTRFSPIGSVILGLIILGIARNFTLLLLSQVLFGCAYGISYPLFLDQSIKYTTPNNRGVGMGMFQSIYAIGMFGGPLFSTYLNAKFGLMMTVSILSFTVLIFYFSGLIWYDHLISKFISTNTGN